MRHGITGARGVDSAYALWPDKWPPTPHQAHRREAIEANNLQATSLKSCHHHNATT